jgi:diguanylate cyclase (GGDEF)-like protein
MTAALSSKWLVRANHYEWIADYLAARGMVGAVRWMMAIISASWVVCLFVLLVSADGPRDDLSIAMMLTAVMGGVGGVVLWASRLPSRRQSLVFALVANGSVALACLAYPNAQGALTGCIAFSTTAAYIAFFHSTALVVYNFGLAATVAVIAAARVAASGHIALALVDLFLVVQVNMAMPAAIYVVVRALGVDLERADRDPLTGLLNRRSFQRHTRKLLAGADAASRTHLAIAMIDLDDFKRVNDTKGHQAGDDALVAVGRALGRAVVDSDAVIARRGGEEFIVAVVLRDDDCSELARQICKGIAELPVAITASVGTTCTPLGELQGPTVNLRARIDELVEAADDAMYLAKRAGGNRFHHAEVESC